MLVDAVFTACPSAAPGTQLDVDAKRITVIGKGTADPLYPNPASDAQAAANRRVVSLFIPKPGGFGIRGKNG